MLCEIIKRCMGRYLGTYLPMQSTDDENAFCLLTVWCEPKSSRSSKAKGKAPKYLANQHLDYYEQVLSIRSYSKP